VTVLRPTAARLDLMRAIAAGKVQASRSTAGNVLCVVDGKPGYSRAIVNRLNELGMAGLATGVSPFQFDLKPVEVTEAGRLWLAEHGKET
jgi:hypothetical protein